MVSAWPESSPELPFAAPRAAFRRRRRRPAYLPHPRLPARLRCSGAVTGHIRAAIHAPKPGQPIRLSLPGQHRALTGQPGIARGALPGRPRAPYPGSGRTAAAAPGAPKDGAARRRPPCWPRSGARPASRSSGRGAAACSPRGSSPASATARCCPGGGRLRHRAPHVAGGEAQQRPARRARRGDGAGSVVAGLIHDLQQPADAADPGADHQDVGLLGAGRAEGGQQAAGTTESAQSRQVVTGGDLRFCAASASG